MKKMIRIGLWITILTVIMVQAASAQLINYGRRNQFINGSTDSPKSDDMTVPQWAKETPKVTNNSERRYDINRDGLLQSAEVKVMLRDVIETVEDRGSVVVYSDILKEYDKNKDRYITAAELDKIRQDAQN
jgi:hypothetical protein